LKNLDLFDLQYVQAFGGWSRTIARRHLIDRHRRQRTHGEVLARVSFATQTAPVAQQRLEQHQQHAVLEAAIAKLPPGQRRAVVLHHVEEVDLETIAAQEQLAVGTIKSRLHRARARLARILGGKR